MAVSSLQIAPAVAPDPNAKPADNVVETANGVQIDPTKAAGNKEVDTSKLILGKFKDQSELEKAYTESQQKITELSTKPSAADAGAAEQAKALALKAGIDMPALSKEYAEKGALSPETLKSLAEKGVTQAHVDAYIGGLKAQAAQLRSTLSEVAGGDDALKSVYDWAATNMSADEVAAYNATVESGNVLASKLSLAGIVARFTAANGQEPALLKDTAAASAGGVAPFKSNAQITEAMSDPRYKSDPAYRASVAARLDVTDMRFPR